MDTENSKILVVGGGCWGTVIAQLVAKNVYQTACAEIDVKLWIYDELYETESGSRNLSDIINEKRENVKYLPGFKLPDNLSIVTDLKKYGSEADYFIFVLPHEFLYSTCLQLQDTIKRSAQAIVLSKGIFNHNNKPLLPSQLIKNNLKIPCCVLSGANIAVSVANKLFSESTLAYEFDNSAVISFWKKIFDTEYFKINVIPDIAGTQICGALKNVIALAVGFSTALNSCSNTTAAIMRIGMAEIKMFARIFFKPYRETFDDSAGIADLITTCLEECDRKLSWSAIEKKHLQGQKLQGPSTAQIVGQLIQHYQLQTKLPLLWAVYKISFVNSPLTDLFESLAHPTHHKILAPQDCSLLK